MVLPGIQIIQMFSVIIRDFIIRDFMIWVKNRFTQRGELGITVANEGFVALQHQ
jgi:hypothetical protein